MSALRESVENAKHSSTAGVAADSGISEIPGFPFPSFDAFVAAARRNEVTVSMEPGYVMRWAREAAFGPTVAAGKFKPLPVLWHVLWETGWLWVGLAMTLAAWSTLGLAA